MATNLVPFIRVPGRITILPVAFRVYSYFDYGHVIVNGRPVKLYRGYLEPENKLSVLNPIFGSPKYKLIKALEIPKKHIITVNSIEELEFLGYSIENVKKGMENFSRYLKSIGHTITDL